MRKVLLFFLIYFFTTVAAVISNPYYTTDIKNQGYGFLEINKTTIIYKEPDSSSERLVTLQIDEIAQNFSLMDSVNNSSRYFVAQNKMKTKGFLIVTDEKENGWYKVCYLQNKSLFGWIKTDAENFLSLKQFYTVYGKKNGIYFFKDVFEEDRKLYAQPFEKSEDKKNVENYKYAQKIQLIMIKGNWMLVRVFDIDSSEKIGYVRWRTNDGTLLMFPTL